MLELHTCGVGPWGTNAFGLICPQTRESVLIDPGGDPEKLSALLSGSRPAAILVTHSHPDHIGALPQMQQVLEVPVMAHPVSSKSTAHIKADRWLTDGDRIEVGRHWIDVRHTPGHSDDQLCFLLSEDRRAIVGDTIFEGGPGKTWSPSNFQITLQTLGKIVLTWHNDTICYPGHGSSFRLGDLRKDIEAFLSKDHGNFFGDATWGM